MTGVDDGSIAVEWEAPESDGGSVIIGYTLEVCFASGKTGLFKEVGKTDAKTTRFVNKALYPHFGI